MITFYLRSADLARIRFAFSPLWECLAAFRTWQAPISRSAGRQWQGFFDRAEGRSGWPLLRALSLGPTGAIPDFLAPPPVRPFVRFTDELESLRATPSSVVAAELRGNWPEIAQAVTGTGDRYVSFLNDLADELTLFWQLVIEPAWPRVLDRLEAEVVYRSRVLAFGGTDAVLSGLHPDVRFIPQGKGGKLQVRTNGAAGQRGAGGGLLLVPSVFAWPDVYAVARAPWRPTLAYPAQGIAELWLSSTVVEADDDCRLARLLGAPRARVLRLLTRPRSTSDLASTLGASPSTVSQHVTNLCAAGFLTRVRRGRRVLYSLNERGDMLLRAGD